MLRTPLILMDGINALEDLVNTNGSLVSWTVVEEFFGYGAIEIEAESDLAFGAGYDLPEPPPRPDTW